MSASSNFRPPIVEEMRELWLKHRDPAVRRLLLEIHHLRGVLVEVESLRESIDRVWKEEVGGQLVALYQLRCRLHEERVRIGILSGSAATSAVSEFSTCHGEGKRLQEPQTPGVAVREPVPTGGSDPHPPSTGRSPAVCEQGR
jgi:hypothetical protein